MCMLPYRHTQIGRTIIVIVSIATGLLAALFVMRRQLEPLIPVFVVFVLAMSLMSSLTIEVTLSTLRFYFGLGIIRRRIPLAEIERWKETHTSLLSGWGIHLTLRGWLYNVSGFTAVEITLKNGRRVTLGTDEPSRLCAALEEAKKKGLHRASS
jgi:hypothetical protein